MGQHMVVAALFPRGTHRKTALHLQPGHWVSLSPGPMPWARTEHHPLDRGMSGVCWAGLCGEQAARQGESLAGMGQKGEGVSVGLLSCWLQT